MILEIMFPHMENGARVVWGNMKISIVLYLI